MSAVIKSQDLASQSSIRSLAAFVRPSPPQRDERTILNAQITALEDELRRRDQAIADLHADVTRALADGRSEGHKAGFVEAEDRQSARLLVLEEALRRAQEKLSLGMTSLERLAVVLASDCLEVILGNADAHTDLVEDIIRAQLARLDRGMLLAVKLSRHDFPDDDALSSLGTRLGLPAITLAASDDMPAGGCVMTLRLGTMDIGVKQQWSALRHLLGHLALPEEAS
jgi:flagellar biosynthesis/type III secretory pathway protein FliH